jgi:hypothetical protein
MPRRPARTHRSRKTNKDNLFTESLLFSAAGIDLYGFGNLFYHGGGGGGGGADGLIMDPSGSLSRDDTSITDTPSPIRNYRTSLRPKAYVVQAIPSLLSPPIHVPDEYIESISETGEVTMVPKSKRKGTRADAEMAASSLSYLGRIATRIASAASPYTGTARSTTSKSVAKAQQKALEQ